MQLLECQITQKCIELATSLLPKNVIIDFHIVDYAHWRIEKRTKFGCTDITTTEIPEDFLQTSSSDLVLKFNTQTFYSIIQGNRNPIRAFLEEEIEMFGDVGLAITLYSILPEIQDMGMMNAK
jgi:hypothetical protein